VLFVLSVDGSGSDTTKQAHHQTASNNKQNSFVFAATPRSSVLTYNVRRCSFILSHQPQ
jgi:hypothetical protein